MNVVRVLVVATLGLATAAAAASRVPAEHVTVSLVAEHTHLAPGRATWLGLHFDVAPHWHVYWRNPGDSGEAPSVAWTLPPGFTAGPIEWPAPQRIAVGPLANYGYEGPVLLPVRLEVANDATPDPMATIAAEVSWLVCRAEECIPGAARLDLPLPVRPGRAPPDPQWQTAFQASRRRAPAPSVAAEMVAGSDDELQLRVPGLHVPPESPVAFFPETPGVIENAAPQRARVVDGVLEILLARDRTHDAGVAALDGVVTIGTGDAMRAHRITAAAPGGSLVLALAFAVAGGLLLNLMPCVFPVLSLKVLSFVRQADEMPTRVRRHGWVFTLGIVSSFWLLAGTLLALRAGGEQLGWGFQLQSPVAVALLAALMVFLGLNLAGVFEVGLGLTTLGSRAERTSGLAGSFWTGVLATIVATPCTAPFMGVALGWALTRPAGPAMLVFTALGLGMAAPYLVLAHVPSALRLLPRPGPWMETLRTLLAFPLFATALWLVWVFHLQVGSEAAFVLLGALLVLALSVRLVGEAQARRGATSWRVAGAVVAAAGLVLGVSSLAPSVNGRPAAVTDPFWGSWTPEREAELRQAGTPLFVNYTAAWCLTCQVNERLVFAAADVREAFRRAGVAVLKADWTDRNAAIARALDRHGRSGVPLYVLYSSVPGTPAHILPQLPTRADVIRAVDVAAQPQT